MSGVTTATVIAGVAAAASAASAIKGLTTKAPKGPATPEPNPAAPTINDAQKQASDADAVNMRKGALANLMAPVGQQSAANTSLRNILGG